MTPKAACMGVQGVIFFGLPVLMGLKAVKGMKNTLKGSHRWT